MNAVAKSQGAELTLSDLKETWGNEQISSSDIIIPQILAMQGLSEFVTDGKAKFGEFVNNFSLEVVGSINKPMEFVPFYVDKTLKTSKEINNKFVLDKIEALTPINEHLPWEDIVGTFKVRREHVYTVYCMVPGQPLPVYIRFKGKSKGTGKKICTEMYAMNMEARKLPPCATTMLLTGKKEQNEKGTFVVFGVEFSGKTSADTTKECLKWYGMVKKGQAKASDDHEDDIPAVPSSAKSGKFDADNMPF